jgi:hypothetical protein
MPKGIIVLKSATFGVYSGLRQPTISSILFGDREREREIGEG